MASDIGKILCPTDWSEPSRVALQSAVCLARREGARLVLLHVVPALVRVPGLSCAASRSEAIKHEAFQKLAALVAQYVPPDVRVQPVVGVGEAADEIHLAALGCDVVVMSTKGRAGWQPRTFGSVAQGVLNETTCLIFVIGPPDSALQSEMNVARNFNLPFERVLCPTDWSQAAEVALREAITISLRHGAQLLLFHAVQPPAEPQVANDAWWRGRESQHNFDALSGRHPHAKDARRPVTRGVAGVEIGCVALAENAAVIVMSSHGRSGWKPGEVGAVARKVLRLIPCPVLLVPATAPNEHNLSSSSLPANAPTTQFVA